MPRDITSRASGRARSKTDHTLDTLQADGVILLVDSIGRHLGDPVFSSRRPRPPPRMMLVGNEQQHRARTADGHYVVIDGRRWRASDPSLPEDVDARLRRHLMSARRAVRTALTAGDSAAEHTARSRVQMAKTALGERGTPWWEQSLEERRDRWEQGLGRLDAENDH